MKYVLFLAFASLMASAAGCTIDKPQAFAEFCPELAFILTVQDSRELECLVGECSQYKDSFRNNRCPDDYPYCIMIPEQPHFCAKTCARDSHIKEDSAQAHADESTLDYYCEANSPEHCGPMREKCTELPGWLDGSCVDSRCKADECQKTYRLDNGICKAYQECCGLYCAQCNAAKEPWICSGINDDDDCIQTCPDGRVDCHGVCINPLSDPNYCGADTLCTKFVECGSGQSCVQGECQDNADSSDKGSQVPSDDI